MDRNKLAGIARATGILVSVLLVTGFAACESSPDSPATDLALVEASLDQFATDRARVIQAVGAAREQELHQTTPLDHAAARHALDLAQHRTSTHMGFDGSSPSQRVAMHGVRMDSVSEFIFQIEGEPDDLGARAAATWLAPFEDNAVRTETATHAAVAFAERTDGGYVGVLLLAQR